MLFYLTVSFVCFGYFELTVFGCLVLMPTFFI